MDDILNRFLFNGYRVEHLVVVVVRVDGNNVLFVGGSHLCAQETVILKLAGG